MYNINRPNVLKLPLVKIYSLRLLKSREINLA